MDLQMTKTMTKPANLLPIVQSIHDTTALWLEPNNRKSDKDVQAGKILPNLMEYGIDFKRHLGN